MKVILSADVDKLGRLGDVVEVKPGYGRNYLLPKGLALLATAANTKQFELNRKKLQKKMDELRFSAQSLCEKIETVNISIPVRVGENEKLYGSVTSASLADALAEKEIVVDRRKILLVDPIRSLGEFVIEIKLHPDVRAKLNVAVVRHDAEQQVEPEKQPAEISEDEE